MPQRTLDVDGHLFVVSQISGITKVLLTPEQDGKRLVFFDVLLRGSSTTLRVSREAMLLEVDDAIAVVDQWRAALVLAVEHYPA